MASKLVAAFLRCSLGTMNYAATCLLGGQVADGLDELSGQSLYEELATGLALSARGAGVAVADLEPHLPMAELRAAAERLDAAQLAAVNAWQAHAGHLGGLMEGVADLTVDGRALEVSAFLERLAKKVVRDRSLSEPLRALGLELTLWLSLIERCRVLLETGVLAKAYARRRTRRRVLFAIVGVVVASVAALLVWLSAAKARIDVALRSSDPCVGSSLEKSDVAWATDAQRRRVTELGAQCEAAQRRAQLEREEQRRREERMREEERVRRLKAVKCASIARRLAHSESASEPLSGDDSPFLRRIEKGVLAPSDMAVAPLPCSETESASQISQAYEAAVLLSPAAWTSANVLSERVQSILRTHAGALAGVHKQTFASRAEEAAKRGLVQGRQIRSSRPWHVAG